MRNTTMKKNILELALLAALHYKGKPDKEPAKKLLLEKGIHPSTIISLTKLETYDLVFTGHVLFTLETRMPTIDAVVQLMIDDCESSEHIEYFLDMVKSDNYKSFNTRPGFYPPESAILDK